MQISPNHLANGKLLSDRFLTSLFGVQRKNYAGNRPAQSEVYKQEWKEIIFLAIEEIETATKSFLMSRAEYELAKKSSQDTAAIVEKTRQRLTAGLVSELELLEDERQFLRTNMVAVESKMQVFQFALNLSKSLGLR